MATTKLSALSALTAPDGAEELLINDGGTSKKITITNVSKLNLKGGDLTEELKDYQTTTIYNISDFFEEDFFETKKVVHLPLKWK